MMSTYIFTAECSDQVFLVSRVVADCDWETTSPEKPAAWAVGLRLVPVGRSLGHAQVSWAVGRCRLSAGAPVVREMAVREMKGREMKVREMKFLHLSCLQPNYYQGMMLQKHDYNDTSKKG